MKNIKTFENFQLNESSESLSELEETYIKFCELFKSENILGDVNNDMYDSVPSPLFAINLIKKYSKPGYNFIDIGCGYGNIVRIAEELKLNSKGIELKKELKKYHQGISVDYTNAINYDYSNYDIIYLYRPISSIDKSNELFKQIFTTSKKGAIIIYIFPHDFFSYKEDLCDVDNKKIKNDFKKYFNVDINIKENNFSFVTMSPFRKRAYYPEDYLVLKNN